MKKINLLMIISLIMCYAAFGQNTFPSTGATGIGTSTPASSSLLEIKSTTKGVLIPRMTKTQRDAIASPVEGLLVYQTTNSPGFYYYDGAIWKSVSALKKDLSNLSATAINESLVPKANNTLDLGSNTFKWRDAYVSNIKFADGTTMSTAGGGSGGVGGSGTANYVPKFTSATVIGNSTIYDNAGSVGINTTTMVGSANFVMKSPNTTGYGGMYLDMAGSSGRKPFYGFAVGGISKAWTYFDEASNQLRLYNNGDRFVIDNAGNIGIGTTSPGYRLDVQTTGTSAVMQIKKPWTGTGSTNFNLLEVNNTYTFGYGTGIYSSGGQTGIKGYAPNGSQSGYGVIGESFGATGTSYGVYGTASTTGGTAYGVYGTASGPNAFAAFFSGKVQIDGGSDSEPSGGGYLIAGSTASTNISMDNNEIMARNNGAASKLHLNNDGGDVSMCYAGGNVMIGAAEPASGYLLTVDGKVICEELKVQLSENWPDYVFDQDYSLRSIHDLKSFIQTNKHLPGIPSADEMKESGLSVGDMQTRMMEKIEELSLYIIQLQEQIDTLKNSKN